MEKDFTFIKLYDERCAKNLSKLTTISKNIYKTEYKNIKKNWANDFRHQTNMLNACMINQDIRDDDYILCIFYCTSRYADFQFAMTETVSEGETYFQAFKRGLGEELGLRYLNTSEPEFSVKVKSHDRIFHMYAVNLNSETSATIIESVKVTLAPGVKLSDIDTTIPSKGAVRVAFDKAF